jgi:cytochrome P450
MPNPPDATLLDDTRAFLDDPSRRGDPVPLYRRLTTEAPVLAIGDGRWVISGYDAIRTALRSPSVQTSVVGTPWAGDAAGGRDDALGALARAFINEVDGDVHERISQSIQVPWITDPPLPVETWSNEVVDAALAAAGPDGAIDLVDAIFRPLPAVIISRSCNLEMSDLDQLREWASALGSLPMPSSMQPPGWDTAALAAATELTPFVQALIDDRRTKNDDDFLSMIIRRAGDTISPDQLVAIVAGMCVGGQDGVTASITSATAQFLAMDGMIDRLRNAPDLVDQAIWEAQRVDGAHRFTLRYASDDFDLDGQTIAKGDLVMAFLAAGNRDGEAFPDPDTYDIDRRAPGHHHGHGRNLAHSFGEHHCGGTSLGHAMMDAAFRRLLARTTSIEATTNPRDLEHNGNLLFSFIVALPARVEVAPAS